MNKNRSRKSGKSRRSSKSSRTEYCQLEPRKLLASLVMGGDGDDVVTVTYVDANTVDILTNKTLRESVDVSGGLKINLKDGYFDQVAIDHRISADISIAGTEDISIDGGDNLWQIGTVTTTDTEGNESFFAAGRLNNNVTFRDMRTLNGDAGVDTFQVDSSNYLNLTFNGGEGDDVFRLFSKRTPSVAEDVQVPIRLSLITANGDAGDDLFFTNEDRVIVRGGDGYDVVDKSRATIDVGITFDPSNVQNEKVIAPAAYQNRASAYGSVTTDSATFDWTIDGSNATVKNADGDTLIELEGFSLFYGDYSSEAIDRFWILSTDSDLEINDADWVQVGSDTDALESTMDSIEHDIEIKRSGRQFYDGYPIFYAQDNGSPSVQGLSIAARPYKNINDPVVILSDAASADSTFANFGNDQTISGLADGKIVFSDELSPYNNPESTVFSPRITVHGSDQADHFVVSHVWSGTEIQGHDGDDVFMVGSSNASANGDLANMKALLDVTGGAGTDRLFINDQQSTEAGDYRVEANSVRHYVKNEDRIIFTPRFLPITPNDSFEVIRINGSHNYKNQFHVTPDAATKFVVDGSAQTELIDALFINGFEDSRQLSNRSGNGSWQFGNDAQAIHFFGVENPDAAF